MPHSSALQEPTSELGTSLSQSKKRQSRALIAPQDKILVSREDAAEMLSISPRAIDYLVSTRQLDVRRIGARVLIPTSELKRFSRSNHPERLAG